MLKIREVRDEGPDRTLFRLQDGEGSPPSESLARLVAVAARLLQENDLPGQFRIAAPDEVVLAIPPGSRHFLHDGILFAALDAVNDPVRNPTLTLLSQDDPKS